MSTTTNRRIYIGLASLFMVTSLVLIYKIVRASWTTQITLLLACVICYFVEPINKPINQVAYKWYCTLVYENSTFWEIFYDTACVLFPSKEVNQINYGYAPLTKDGQLMPLEKRDEAERMSLQLYYRTATCLETRKDLEGLTILEVSSGRGGGIDYISRTFPVKKIIGLDLSSNNIEWCKKTYSANSKLEFVLGNAETFVDDGTLPAESVDIVMSVDSAHLYPHFDKFINQCKKVLKKGGYLSISDFMHSEKMPQKEEALRESGMEIKQIQSTTEHILHAMDIDGERRRKLVNDHAHPLLKPYFRWQTGAKGSRIYNLLKTGDFKGAGWLLQKF